MKKLLLPLLLAAASLGVAHAQNRSITLKSDGTVEDNSHNTVGYVKNGYVEDRSHNTLGYYKNDYIEDRSHNTLGYYKNGIVEDRSHNTIARESGMRLEEVAVRYFFFK